MKRPNNQPEISESIDAHRGPGEDHEDDRTDGTLRTPFVNSRRVVPRIETVRLRVSRTPIRVSRARPLPHPLWHPLPRGHPGCHWHARGHRHSRRHWHPGGHGHSRSGWHSLAGGHSLGIGHGKGGNLSGRKTGGRSTRHRGREAGGSRWGQAACRIDPRWTRRNSAGSGPIVRFWIHSGWLLLLFLFFFKIDQRFEVLLVGLRKILEQDRLGRPIFQLEDHLSLKVTNKLPLDGSPLAVGPEPGLRPSRAAAQHQKNTRQDSHGESIHGNPPSDS